MARALITDARQLKIEELMTLYIFKRILLMVPTMLMISLIIFMVLNLAPGRPGKTQVGADGTQNAESADARESHRIFKEQFNFDKPILLNTRFALARADVQEKIETIVLSQRPTCPPEAGVEQPAGCLKIEERPGSGEIVEAVETLEDWGYYAVPQLYEIAADNAADERARRIALSTLAQNAQNRLIPQYGRQLTADEKKYNDDTQALNDQMRRWKLSPEQEIAEIEPLLTERWVPWMKENQARYDYSFGDKVSILFTDTRFFKYMSNLAKLDFGVSHIDKKPVLETIGGKLKYSITLSLLSVFLSYIISIPLGVWSAYRQGSKADQAVTVVLFMLYSLPSFFVAVLLLQYLTIGEPFQVFPTGGFVGSGSEEMTALEKLRSTAWHIFLPLMCLTYGGLASLSRYARTGVLDVIRADYIRTARAKGLGEPMVIIKHAVRNGMIPILTLLGTLLPVLFGGSVIIEVIFNIPGLGLYLFESIMARDYNAIMAVLLISSVLTLLGLLVSDLSYAVVDPRITFD